MDIDVIGLRVFPLSLTGEAAMWFTELPYNSIFTWNKLRDAFLARYYPVSKKLNHNARVNNFVALPGESVSSSWDRFTSFLRSVPNHRIDDESLKEYFYRGQDDNNKAVLDTIAGGSYGNVLMLKLPKNYRKSLGITKLGVLGSQIEIEIPSQCSPLTTQPQMRFVKKWLR